MMLKFPSFLTGAAALLLIGLLPSLTCAQTPASNVTCSGSIQPQGAVPTGSDLAVLQGVWYVQTTFEGCNCDDNDCTQIIVGDAPYDAPANMDTNWSYGFSYMKFDPADGDLTTGNAGVLVPNNLDTTQPQNGSPFVLVLDLSFLGIPGVGLQFTDFYFIAAEKNAAGEITTLATYSCPQEGTLGDAQIFFWTRQPYFESPSTFASISALASNAIETFDQFTLQPVYQGEGYCYYGQASTNGGGEPDEVVCECDETFTVSNAAAWGSFLTLFVLLGLTAFICKGRKDGTDNGYTRQ